MPRKKAKGTLRSSNNMSGNLKHLDPATVVINKVLIFLTILI